MKIFGKFYKKIPIANWLLILVVFSLSNVFAQTWDITRFQYDNSSGNLVKKIYPDGHEVSYTYHLGILPKRITYPSGKWKERYYNNRLQVVSNVYSSVNTPNVYSLPNEFGTICRVEDSRGVVYDYGIRPLGQVLTNELVNSPWMNWQLGHTVDQYSRDNGLSLYVDNEKKGDSYWEYSKEGKITRLVCTNSFGRSIEVTYNFSKGYQSGYSIKTPLGEMFLQQLTRDTYRPELVTNILVKFSQNKILERNYEYNAINKLIRWYDSETSNEAIYNYNARGEVVQCEVAGICYGYDFDNAGNCRGFAIGSSTNFFAVNQLNQCTAIIFPDVGSVSQHTYDIDGNLVEAPSMFQYLWDCEDRLISAITQNGSVTNYYDYQNRLLRQDMLGRRRYCIFDRWNLIFERSLDDNGIKEEVEYFWGPDKSGTIDGVCGVGGLIAVSKNGNFYFPYYGVNGDILGYINENGNVVASYTYGPFGEIASSTGNMADSFQFRLMTKRFDTSLKLYDFGDRWYSIALRRWISRDPIGEDGGINLYAFCENDPVNKFDPNGCIPLDTIWDIANIIYDICVGDEVALAADTAALFVPYYPAGTTKLVKAARLSKVEKICPGVKKLEVTYQYLPTAQYKFKHTLPTVKGKGWIRGTLNDYAKFNPGWGDAEIKGLIEEAFKKAKSLGKIQPKELDGFIYDTGRVVGAADGKLTTKIKIHVNSDGRNLHAYPCHR